MALQELHFVFDAPNGFSPLPKSFSHSGVVGSGDMEVLLSKKDLGGKIEFKVVTPVTGFDEIWEKVLHRFAEESGAGDILVEINDNNSTPYVVTTRLRQAILEAREGGKE